MGFPAYTHVLTPAGWKTISQITFEDKVAEVHQDEIVFSHPLDIRSKNFSGKLLELSGQDYGLVTTTDHLHPVRFRSKKTERVEYSWRKSSELESVSNRTWQMLSAAPAARRDHEVHDPAIAQIIGMMTSNLTTFRRHSIRVRVLAKGLHQYFAALLDAQGVQYIKEDRAVFLLDNNPRILAYFTRHRRLRRSALLALDLHSRQTFLQGTADWRFRIKKPSFPTVIRCVPENALTLYEIAALSNFSLIQSSKSTERLIQIRIRPGDWKNVPSAYNDVDYKGKVYSLSMPHGRVVTRTDTKSAIAGDGSGKEL